jgi:hypothetical protein
MRPPNCRLARVAGVLEGSEKDCQVLPARWLTVAPSDRGSLPHQLDRHLPEPEPQGNGDPVIPIERRAARVESQPQWDLNPAHPDALGQPVEMLLGVDDGGRHQLPVHGAVPGNNLRGQQNDHAPADTDRRREGSRHVTDRGRVWPTSASPAQSPTPAVPGRGEGTTTSPPGGGDDGRGGDPVGAAPAARRRCRGPRSRPAGLRRGGRVRRPARPGWGRRPPPRRRGRRRRRGSRAPRCGGGGCRRRCR